MPVEYCLAFEVWSTGLETWEPVVLSSGDLSDLEFVHEKSVSNKTYEFYHDSLNRWFRQPKQ